jgi:hypothetical protein
MTEHGDIGGAFESVSFRATPKRISPSVVYTLADEASRRGQVIGVRMSDIVDEDDRTPWKRPPSGRPKKVVITKPLPPIVRAVLSQRLFIEKAGLPPALIAKSALTVGGFPEPRVLQKAEHASLHSARREGDRVW